MNAIDAKIVLIVRLTDGRTISAPLVWFPRLLGAPVSHRARWELLDDGQSLHWPDVDEDFGVDGLLRGTHAPGGAP